MANTAQSILSYAAKEVGYSRWTDPQNGTKYGRWYGARYGSYFAANGVPFCAMGVSYVFNEANAKCVGIPGAYCPTMLAAARAAGKTVGIRNGKAGDVIYFDWGNDGVADHVGIIVENTGSYYKTWEANTDNGIVAYKTRAYSTVIGVVRPDYGSTSSQPATSKPTTTAKPNTTKGNATIKAGQTALKSAGISITVDGVFGSATKTACIKYVQKQMNSCGQKLVVDGISGPATKAAWNRLGYVYTGHGRSACVKAVQVALMCRGYSVGSDGADGVCGTNTNAAIRSFQQANGLGVDGVVGPATFAKLF